MSAQRWYVCWTEENGLRTGPRVLVQDGEEEQPMTWGYPSLSLGFSSAERVSLQGNCVLSRDFL